jgi:uncharacterized protein (DUF2147 family)
MMLRLLLPVMLLSFPAMLHADSRDVFGTFLTEEQDSHIQISDCGDGSPCGKIVWLDPARLEEGVKPQDVMTKVGEPVLGLLILKDFKRKKEDWRDGTIYAPDKDKTYASRLQRLDDGTLQVKGCLSFFCQTQIWTPVTE